MEELLAKSLEQLEIPYVDQSLTKFIKYKELLQDWNTKINLTAITEDKDIIIKHFIDSATVLSVLNLDKKIRLIDVGTGAGFPGLPLKILNDNIDLVLLDSLNKRINFLNEVVQDLELQNVECIHGRAEEFGMNKDYREKFDISCSRAVAKLSVLTEYCLPFVKIGGQFISMKGPDVAEEISESKKAIETLGGEISDVKSVILPYSDIKHTLIVIKKLRHTSPKYPRSYGKMLKSPL